jgi:hypothetical protein
MCRLYRSNVENVKVIRAVILSDDVLDDDSIDDGTECSGKYADLRKVTRKVQQTLRRIIIAAVK